MTTVGRVINLFTELAYILHTKNQFLLAPENNQKVSYESTSFVEGIHLRKGDVGIKLTTSEFQELLFPAIKSWLVSYDCLSKMTPRGVCTGEYPHLCVGFKSKFRELEQTKSVQLLKDLFFDRIEYYRFMHLWRPQRMTNFVKPSPLLPSLQPQTRNKRYKFQDRHPIPVDVINESSLLLFMWYKPS